MNNDTNKDDAIPSKPIRKTYDELVKDNCFFQSVYKRLYTASKLSMSGITNLITAYEDPGIIKSVLKLAFKPESVYCGQYGINLALVSEPISFLDKLIFGTYKCSIAPPPMTDDSTGAIIRNEDGFVSRNSLNELHAPKDRHLIISGMDLSMEFGDRRGQYISLLNRFRDPFVKAGCRLILVTDEEMELPFPVQTVRMGGMDEDLGNYIVNDFIEELVSLGWRVNISECEKSEIAHGLVSEKTFMMANHKFTSGLIDHVLTLPKGFKEINGTEFVKLFNTF